MPESHSNQLKHKIFRLDGILKKTRNLLSDDIQKKSIYAKRLMWKVKFSMVQSGSLQW